MASDMHGNLTALGTIVDLVMGFVQPRASGVPSRMIQRLIFSPTSRHAVAADTRVYSRIVLVCVTMH